MENKLLSSIMNATLILRTNDNDKEVVKDEFLQTITVEHDEKGVSLKIEDETSGCKYYEYFNDLDENDILNTIKYFSFFNIFYSFTINSEKIETCFRRENVDCANIKFIINDPLSFGIEDLNKACYIIQSIFLFNSKGHNFKDIEKDELISILANLDYETLNQMIKSLPAEIVGNILDDQYRLIRK